MATPTVSNVYEVGALKFEALTDRLIILEDEFRTGYECSGCGGLGDTPCSDCSSGALVGIKPNGKKCSTCEGKGRTTCLICNGKGGLLIAPETSQRRPTSGVIVSAGPGKTDNGVFVPMSLKVGESVLYSNFAGYVIDLDRAGKPVTLRILHESEILCRLEGHLTLTNLKGKSEVAVFNK